MRSTKYISIKAMLIGLIFLLAIVGTILATTLTSVFAFTGSKGTNKAEQLFNATNTYQVSGINRSAWGALTSRSVTYDMNTKINKRVMEKAQITVLTHGLNSDASHWSNNYSKSNINAGNVKFAYDSDSLISKIDEKVGGANIYWAKMKLEKKPKEMSEEKAKIEVLPSGLPIEEDDFNLINITNQKGVYEDTGFIVDRITDISKHIVIVFESRPYEIPSKGKKVGGSAASHNSVYYEFNYMLSSIVYDVMTLNGGILPKINLVGHSRGGITNMQYALDHPDLVASITSLGTPYYGSTTATLFGEKISGDSEGLLNILSPSISFGFSNRWNNDYDRLYKNINATAIGGYSSMAFVQQLFMNDWSGTLKSYNIPVDAACIGIGAIISAKLAHLFTMGFGVDILTSIVSDTISNFVYAIGAGAKIPAMVRVLLSELDIEWRPSLVFWRNDMFVDLGSQLAESVGSFEYGTAKYTGFKRLTRCFETNDGTDFTKVASPQLPIVHNLETRDKTIINMVLDNIELGVGNNKLFYTTPLNSSEIEVSGIAGEYMSSELYIPGSLESRAVTQIGANALSNNFGGREAITSVVIPKSVKRIEARAFEGCTKLKIVTFEEGIRLEYIGYAAFSGCTALERCELPPSLKEMEDFAFFGCKALSGVVTLPDGMTYVGAGAFSDCTAVTGFSLAGSNTEYQAVDGVLFGKAGGSVISSLICYPAGREEIAYTLPDFAAEIAPYALFKNRFLESVDLKKVRGIRPYGLAACEKLGKIISNSVEFTETGALAGTKWLEENTGCYVKLGKVLLRYRGKSKSEYIGRCVRIAEFAFAGNETLEKIEFGYELKRIDDGAFRGCKNLKDIILPAYSRKIDIGEHVFTGHAESLKVLVPEAACSKYEADERWQEYRSVFYTSETKITLVYGNGTPDEVRTVKYGSIVAFPKPKREGYDFDCWVNGGSQFRGMHWWSRTAEAMTLVAKWTPQTYTVKVDPKDGTAVVNPDTRQADNTIPAEFDQKLPDIEPPTRDGYTFLGLYLGDTQYVNPYGKGVKSWDKAEETKLTVQWEKIRYEITFDGGEGSTLSFSSTLRGVDEAYGSLPTATHPERTFAGWVDDNGHEVDSTTRFDEARAVKVTAKWTCTVTFDSGGGTKLDPITVACGTAVKLPSPFRGGYEGTGWRGVVKGAPSEKQGFDAKYTVSRNVTLTAVWRELDLRECYIGNDFYEVWTAKQLNQIRDYNKQENYFEIKQDIAYPGDWIPIDDFKGIIWNRQGLYPTITFTISSNSSSGDVGFVRKNSGYIWDVNFKGRIILHATNGDWQNIGIIAGVNEGGIVGCNVLSYIGEGNSSVGTIYDNDKLSYYDYSYHVDMFNAKNATRMGAVAGLNKGCIRDCKNLGVSMVGRGDMGGIAGVVEHNDSADTGDDHCWVEISNSQNVNGRMYALWGGANRSIGGLIGYMSSGRMWNSTNKGAVITYISPKIPQKYVEPSIGNLVGERAGEVKECKNEGGWVGTGSLYINSSPWVWNRFDQKCKAGDRDFGHG